MKRMLFLLCLLGLWGLDACQNGPADAETTEQNADQTSTGLGEESGEGGGVPAPPVVIRPDADKVLGKRLESYRDQLGELRRSGRMGQTRTMDMVERYTSTLDLNQLGSKYIGTATVLLSNIKRKTGPEQAELQTLLSVSTQVYLDHLVASEAEELHEAHANTLQTVADLMQEQNLDPGSVLKGWDPAPLEGKSGAQVAARIRKIFRS